MLIEEETPRRRRQDEKQFAPGHARSSRRSRPAQSHLRIEERAGDSGRVEEFFEARLQPCGAERRQRLIQTLQCLDNEPEIADLARLRIFD